MKMAFDSAPLHSTLSPDASLAVGINLAYA